VEEIKLILTHGIEVEILGAAIVMKREIGYIM
jgi:hypothetical protein